MPAANSSNNQEQNVFMPFMEDWRPQPEATTSAPGASPMCPSPIFDSEAALDHNEMGDERCVFYWCVYSSTSFSLAFDSCRVKRWGKNPPGSGMSLCLSSCCTQVTIVVCCTNGRHDIRNGTMLKRLHADKTSSLCPLQNLARVR